MSEITAEEAAFISKVEAIYQAALSSGFIQVTAGGSLRITGRVAAMMVSGVILSTAPHIGRLFQMATRGLSEEDSGTIIAAFMAELENGVVAGFKDQPQKKRTKLTLVGDTE